MKSSENHRSGGWQLINSFKIRIEIWRRSLYLMHSIFLQTPSVSFLLVYHAFSLISEFCCLPFIISLIHYFFPFLSYFLPWLLISSHNGYSSSRFRLFLFFGSLLQLEARSDGRKHNGKHGAKQMTGFYMTRNNRLK